MLLALLSLRISDDVGEVFYLPHLSAENATSFCASSKLTVLLLTDNISDFAFCNPAISLYSSTIQFAICDSATANLLNITSFPCYASYHKGELLATDDVKDCVKFAAFCRSMHTKISGVTLLYQAEQLRAVFAGNQTVLIGVDNKEPPADFKHDIPFYGVQAFIVRQFGLSASSGYYVFRPVDRQFIRISRSYRQYLSTPIVPFSSNAFGDRQFLVALFVDLAEENVSVAGREVDTLHDATRKFGKTAAFSIVTEKQPFEAEYGLEYLSRPFVLVWKEKIDKRRWIWQGPGNLQDFLRGVFDGETEIAPLVKQEVGENELTLRDFESRTASGDVFVLVYSDGNEELEMRKAVVASVRELLPSVTFLEFDAGRNECPRKLSLKGKLPIIVALKGGEVQHEIEFRRDTTVQNLVDIVIERSSAKIEKPEVDYDGLQRNISRNFPMSDFELPSFGFDAL